MKRFSSDATYLPSISWDTNKYWILCILLSFPVFLFYGSHYVGGLLDDNTTPTGFIQIDQLSYIANAREYVEDDEFTFTYPLPFSEDYNNEKIYFQPQIFLLGQILRYTNIDPGILLTLFGFICTILCIRICISIYLEYIGHRDSLSTYVGITLFVWGGGLLFFSGLFYLLFQGNDWLTIRREVFFLDPGGGGWWFLNLGRNFIYPMEAFYHLLFFSTILAIYREKYVLTLILLAVLSSSHPYAGTSALLISITWAFIERFYVRKYHFPNYFLPSIAFLLIAHLSYYLIYLPTNVEHRIIMKQWEIDWSMTAESFIPAYSIVFLLFITRVANPQLLIKLFSDRFNRLLVVWAIVNFLLENHEFAMTPHQPLHFSRGYTWSALFLLGYPAATKWLIAIRKRFSPLRSKLIVVVLCLVFLSDNITWFTKSIYYEFFPWGGIKMTTEQSEVINFLNSVQNEQDLLLLGDRDLCYLATAYTDFRPFYSHGANTAFSSEKYQVQKTFLSECQLDDTWLRDRELVVIYDREVENCLSKENKQLFKNEKYIIHRVDGE